MKPFQYFSPNNIEEVIFLLMAYKEEAKIIAGGTDLVVQMRRGLIKPKYIIDISNLKNLSYIRDDDKNGLKIGAITTIRDIEKSNIINSKYSIISQAASKLGSVAIRNIATVGGNLCNAMPIADMSQVLLALSGRAKLVGPNGERFVPLEKFFIDVGKTCINIGELLVEIQIPTPLPNSKGLYIKHLNRGSIDLPIVNVAIFITLNEEKNFCKDIKIVLGSVAPTPIRAFKAETVIKGNQIDDNIIEKTAEIASEEAHPRPNSIRASVEYKKEMIKVYIRKLIKEAILH